MDTAVPVGADHLWVDDTGGDAVPLVLLHPGIADSTIWDRLLPLLGGRRVVRYDQPGYGRSAPATQPRRPVDDLVAVLDALAIPRAHLVGNSKGGETAMALAVTAPERVASLTLLCSAAGGYPWPAEAEDPDGEAEYERLAAAEDLDGLTELYLRTFAASGADDYLRAQFRATTELELSGADLAEQNPPQWDDAPGISVPVAVVVGERDERASRIGGLALAERIPGAELVRLDADHLPQYRDPAAVAEVVLRTVART